MSKAVTRRLASHFRRGIATAVALTLGVGLVSMTNAQAASETDARNMVAIRTVANDTFARTLTDSFGSAKTGGAYTFSGKVSVNGTRGVVSSIAKAGSASQFLPSTSVRDAEVTSSLIIPTVSTANTGLYDSQVVRRQANGNRYHITTIIGANGTVQLRVSYVAGSGSEVIIGTTVTSATKITSGAELITQSRIVGTVPAQFLSRAYIKGSAVPDWELKATDARIVTAGYVGFSSYLSSTGTPTTFYRDNFTVNELALSTPTSTTAPAAAETSFTFAVMPDTQQELLKTTDPRFGNRVQYLLDNKRSLNLKFVTHTGDVQNWDTPDHAQYVMASTNMDKLNTAGIPYTMAIGNHDTQATGPGGSARDPANTKTLVRDTKTWNSFYTAADYGNVGGAFEANKTYNIYTTYEAGGYKWLVLVLEFDPRIAAVNWAKTVVASHPNYNVIVVTHSYLLPDGSISNDKEYGETSGKYLFDNLVKVYPNVKMVFSGHLGTAASRVDTGINGNKIYSMLNCYHSDTSNPVRLVTVDTKAGTIKAKVYGPSNKQTFADGTASWTSVGLVKP